MFGEEDTKTEAQQQKEIDDRLALIRREARAIADTNEAIHAKVPAMTDSPAQVRIALYGNELPPEGSSPKAKFRFCQIVLSRIPSLSSGEAWEVRRTLADIRDLMSSEGQEDVVDERLDLMIARLQSYISTVDPKAASGGLTGIGALITSDRRETLNQTVRQLPLASNSPGLVEGFKNLISGRRS
jgi:hypothetical protein